MGKKIHIALLFGGQSVEHEVSLQSGCSVASALDADRYQVRFIGIDKKGRWAEYDPQRPLIHPEDPERICLGEKKVPFNPFDWSGVDVVFPALHGTLGEDGTLQGLLRLTGIPFVGADVLGSAIGMDKTVAKKLAKEAGFRTADWRTFKQGGALNWENLQFPLFVKPNDSGSSVGISKIYDRFNLEMAIEHALCFSDTILLEEAIDGREIQVAALGNENPQVSLPCEIIPKGEFHTYESKYLDKGAAQFLYPAPLEIDERTSIQQTALDLYRALSCEGFGRIDLFLTKTGEIYFNEINTIPGLTAMSPYAKMWETSGVSYRELLDRLIALALDRHARQKQFADVLFR